MSASLVSLWTEVRQRLEAAGVETPVIDARLLVEAGAGVSRLEIVTDPRRELSQVQTAAVLAMAERRAAREPLAYITGVRAFWKQELRVSADVLIPRAETETLVEAALEMTPLAIPARMLDLGVGSGAILFAVLAERPLMTGLGIDLSPEALAVAQANCERLGLAARARFRHGNWGEGLDEAFDIVVSNPPYIAAPEIAGLALEVTRFEPRLALDGGRDGLDAYRAIIPSLVKLLRPGGRFGLEVGSGQAEAVLELAHRSGLVALATRADLAGVARVVTGTWPGTK